MHSCFCVRSDMSTIKQAYGKLFVPTNHIGNQSDGMDGGKWGEEREREKTD